MRELKSIFDKYGVSFAKDLIYYPGEDACARVILHTIGDKDYYTQISIDDIADLRGGWK